MTKADDPAFPNAVPENFQFAEPGLTKREYFAATAMQGLISYSHGKNKTVWFDDVAKFSVMHADALIAELAKAEPEEAAPDDVWIEWDGQDKLPPIDAEELVKVRFSDGDISQSALPAFEWRWPHWGNYADIIAYRLVKGGEA